MDWTQFGQEIGRETSSMSYTGTLAASFGRSDALLKKGISGLHRQTNKLRKHAEQLPIPFRRYQDTHNQISIMVMASARWFGVRLDVVASLIVGSVAAAAVFVAQDAGKY